MKAKTVNDGFKALTVKGNEISIDLKNRVINTGSSGTFHYSRSDVDIVDGSKCVVFKTLVGLIIIGEEYVQTYRDITLEIYQDSLTDAEIADNEGENARVKMQEMMEDEYNDGVCG